MATQPAASRRVPRVAALLVVWALAVPLAAALGVLALRSAGGDTAVISAAEAAAIATESAATPPADSPSPATSPDIVPSPAPSPDASAAVVERRVPGAVLGMSCAQGVPTLVWSVPDPGWRVRDTELEDSGLRIRLEAGDDDEVEVTVVCRDGQPEVAEAVRSDD